MDRRSVGEDPERIDSGPPHPNGGFVPAGLRGSAPSTHGFGEAAESRRLDTIDPFGVQGSLVHSPRRDLPHGGGPSRASSQRAGDALAARCGVVGQGDAPGSPEGAGAAGVATRLDGASDSLDFDHLGRIALR